MSIYQLPYNEEEEAELYNAPRPVRLPTEITSLYVPRYSRYPNDIENYLEEVRESEQRARQRARSRYNKNSPSIGYGFGRGGLLTVKKGNRYYKVGGPVYHSQNYGGRGFNFGNIMKGLKDVFTITPGIKPKPRSNIYQAKQRGPHGHFYGVGGSVYSELGIENPHVTFKRTQKKPGILKTILGTLGSIFRRKTNLP